MNPARLFMIERFKVYYESHVQRIYPRGSATMSCREIVERTSEALLHDDADGMIAQIDESPALKASLEEIGLPADRQAVEAWLDTPLEDQ
jgi:hypothetical protein